jgi:DDE superfamily endonuclease
LSTRPESKDAPDYSGCKLGYSISTLVVCDDQRKIRYYLGGWPGSTHDNRVFRNSVLYHDNARFFSNNQYLLADTAYTNTTFMVSTYKKPNGGSLNNIEELFNTALARPRVLSEHCIGVWKGRFPFLKGIRMKITDDTNSLKHILRMLDTCVILHNFLIEQNDEPSESWMDVDGADDGGNVDDDGEQRTINPNQINDLRRQQLHDYVADYFV